MFSLVCLQGQDDETGLPGTASVTAMPICRCVSLLSEGLHGCTKTPSIYAGGTERLSTTPAVEKE